MKMRSNIPELSGQMEPDPAPLPLAKQAMGSSTESRDRRRNGEKFGVVLCPARESSFGSRPVLLTGFRSEAAYMVLHARLATEDPAGVSSYMIRRGG